MRKCFILILTLIVFAPAVAEADPCPFCGPVYGYYRSCQAKCVYETIGGICQSDSTLPREAYCLQQTVEEPPVYSCQEGSYDCCCARVPPPL